MDWFLSQGAFVQGLLATLFTYSMTAIGAAAVFFMKRDNRKILDVMMGFAGGVMIAASFWSLLQPAVEMAEELGKNAWLTAGIGFMAGAGFIMLSDLIIPSVKLDGGRRRTALLTLAVTMHNIPEGLAVGVAFGTVAAGIPGATVISAVMLAVGIGLQNLPEGVCVAMPLRAEGHSRLKSFFVGQLSGVVEPIAGVLGVLCALTMREILPFALTFSSGAMIAVVCSELIPEPFRRNKGLATAGVTMGFVVMTMLDVGLG